MHVRARIPQLGKCILKCNKCFQGNSQQSFLVQHGLSPNLFTVMNVRHIGKQVLHDYVTRICGKNAFKVEDKDFG